MESEAYAAKSSGLELHPRLSAGDAARPSNTRAAGRAAGDGREAHSSAGLTRERRLARAAAGAEPADGARVAPAGQKASEATPAQGEGEATPAQGVAGPVAEAWEEGSGASGGDSAALQPSALEAAAAPARPPPTRAMAVRSATTPILRAVTADGAGTPIMAALAQAGASDGGPVAAGVRLSTAPDSLFQGSEGAMLEVRCSGWHGPNVWWACMAVGLGTCSSRSGAHQMAEADVPNAYLPPRRA
jgi:hypothetical protein